MSRQRQRMVRAVRAFAALLLLAGCGGESPAATSSHVQVNELFLRSPSTVTITRTEMIDRRWTPSQLTMRRGEVLDLRVIYLDFNNREFTLDGSTVHQTRGAIDGSAARWVAVGAHGRLEAVQTGTARLRVSVFHIDHNDFDSPWLTIQVIDP
jgi:hypothetical protein